MPEFVNPFYGRIPECNLTQEELIRAIRLDPAAEQEAVHTYIQKLQEGCGTGCS